MKLIALGRTVIVKFIRPDRKGTLIIPDTAKEYRIYHGDFHAEVISVGPEYEFKDELKEGDKVWTLRHEGKGFKYGGIEYHVMKERKHGSPRIAGIIND